MLPKKYRLTVPRFNQIPLKNIEFNQIFLNTKIKNNHPENPKFAFIIPKTLNKRSTVRHLAKRIVEELVREKIKSIIKPMSFLIRLKKIITRKDRFKLEEELDYFFQKINSL